MKTKIKTLLTLLSGPALVMLIMSGCYYLGVAHAAPATAIDISTGPAAVDTGWDVFVKDGPIWFALFVAWALLSTFVNKQSRLAKGRLLAILTGASFILTAVIQWHFNGAPSSGIMTAVVMAFSLILHPETLPDKPSGGAPA